MAQVEYQILYEKKDTEIEIVGKYNYITTIEIVVTEENKNIYPMLNIGDVDITYDREKIQEFRHRFSLDTSKEEINKFLRYQTAYYGEVVNE